MSTYDLKFAADVSKAQAEIAKIPGFTEKAAANAALKLVNEQRKAAKAAEKEQEAAAKKAASGWSDAFKGVAKVSGFGDLVEKAGDLSSGLSGAAAAGTLAAGAVVGLGLAAAGASVAAVSLERSAAQAIETLDKLGQQDLISPEARDRVLDANAALDSVGVAASVLEVSLASGLAPIVTSTAETIGELVLFTDQAVRAFNSGAVSINSWGALLGSFVAGPAKLYVDAMDSIMDLTLGDSAARNELVAKVDAYAKSVGDAAFAVKAETEEQKEALKPAKSWAELVEEIRKRNDQNSESFKRQADAVKAAEKSYREMFGAMRDLGMLAEKSTEDQLSGSERIRAALEAELVEIDKKKAAALDAAAAAGTLAQEQANIEDLARAARLEAEKRFLREREKINRDTTVFVVDDQKFITEEDRKAAQSRRDSATQEFEHRRTLLRILTDEEIAAREASAQAARAQAADWQALADATGPYTDALGSILGGVGDIAALSQQAHQDKVQSLQDEIKVAEKKSRSENDLIAGVAKADAAALREQIKNHKAAAMRSFRAGQAAALAATLLSSAQAYISVMASPTVAALGWFAPAAAAGIVVPPTAVSIAQILAQKPPSFARGGVVQANLEDGEGVANRRAMADPTFRRSLDAANEGRASGGNGNGGDVTNVWLNDRLLVKVYGRMKRLAGEPVPPSLGS